MQKIKKYVTKIDEELADAQNYAECYVEYKAKNNPTRMQKYKDMSIDELRHATILHDIAMAEIDELNKVYQPSQEMLDKWNYSHKSYVEKSAWIKQMLSL